MFKNPSIASVLFGPDFIATAAAVAFWAVLGVVLCVGALKIFDFLTPGKLDEQVFREGNVAAAIVYGAAFLGCAVIIASAMH